MTHDELVEKVARALFDTWAFDVTFDEDPQLADASREDARIAISIIAESLKEPTERMFNAGYEIREEATVGGYRWSAAAKSPWDAWRMMLSVSPLYPKGGRNAK